MVAVIEERKNEEGEAQYKEVVVIGNGPSGIIVSYFLAGNWPYYNGNGESTNEMLHYRLLADSDPSQEPTSLVQQELSFLAQGLEGRSPIPVALLFDSLNHPQADLGLELPSLLRWNYEPANAMSHVVIGKGPPGGAWQSMDGSVLTISLGCWMELPQMNFREWQASLESRCFRESRSTVGSVARYYCDYVRANGLKKYFLCDSVITEVTQVPSHIRCLPNDCDISPIDETEEELNRIHRRHTISEIPLNSNTGRKITKNRNRPLWQVKGFTLTDDKENPHRPFTFLTRNLVLATGASDLPNRLDVPGENLPFVLHSLNDLEQLIVRGHLNRDSDPILVIGAGLSAADAITAARFHSVQVIHLFRRSVNDSNLIFRQLPENMYPEYHKVYQMMRDPEGYEGYKAHEMHIVVEISPDKRVKIAGPTTCGVLKVSYIVICIGSHPDLGFMGGIEKNLGVHPGMPIDCKRNPIAIDYTTHESVREPGLYALGPLVGENFVRFLQGGALAITNHLAKRRKSIH